MKNLVMLAFCFAVVFSASNVYGAEPQTQKGAKSLFFGLGGLNELSFDNTTVGAQYNISDNMGIWCDLGFQSNTSKANENATEVKGSMVEFNVGVLFYVFQKGPVAAYFSPQIGIGTGGSETGNVKHSKSEFTGGVSIGAEWWAFDGVSLTASTLIGFTSTTITDENGSNKTEATSSQIGFLGAANSKFLVSFYF
ncbi:MAG: outer membrane beta-barrel protein [Candidatus Kapabacteria bacterium]|nr:outer membrane beta-barrel protein [Candidatus Kapabacteria bacterium]